MVLEKQRAGIDAVDQQIVALFEERMAWVKQVIEVKLENGMDILDTSREAQVIDKAVSRLENKDLEPELRDFFTEMMRVSRAYQAKIAQSSESQVE